MSEDSKTVHLVTTGGTIANPLDIEGYLTGEELVEAVPETTDIADITTADIASVGSSSITADVWYDLKQHIDSVTESDDKPDGIVVTHGSNTVEETAYVLNLTVNTDVPVVLTAAQRNHGLVGNDGDRNLVDAVRVASHPDAPGRGALVVANDQVHHSRDVTKTVSGRPDAWSSGDFGPVGLTDKYGQARFYRQNERAHTTDAPFDVPPAEQFPVIEILYSAADMDERLVEKAASADIDGLVVAALPTGTPSNPVGKRSQKEALVDLADSMPIVISGRKFEGWPERAVLEEDTFIWGDTLTPQKARILLALGLGNTDDRETLQSYFLEH